MEGLRRTNPKLSHSQPPSLPDEGESTLSLRHETHRLRSGPGLARGFSANEFECLASKKTFIERNDFLNVFDIFEVTAFDKTDLLALQALATLAEERFDAANYAHLGLLRDVYRSAFGLTDSEKNPNFIDADAPPPSGTPGAPAPPGPAETLDPLLPELLDNPRWQKFGFQTPTPATDFRDAGVLSLRAMLHFLRHERVTYRIIRDFNRKYDNYLFACAVISGLQFLKTYFHFGVVNSFSTHLAPKLCSRKVAKAFLQTLRRLGDADRLEFFLSLADVYVKQMFRFWVEENARTPLHVVDFAAKEAEFQKRWRKRVPEVFRRCDKMLAPENVLKQFAREERDG